MSPSAQHLQWSGHTDRGKVRPNNEDAFLTIQFDARELRYLGKIGESAIEHADFVFAVSDGMGGAKAGEFASRIAVDRITHLLPRSYKQSAVGLAAGHADVLTELFSQIHHAMLHLGYSYQECAGMGATLSLCWFTPGWMHVGHVGDSRIYYLPAGKSSARQLTHDDTHVGWLHRHGQINEREARTHPRRNVLQKALGAGHQFVDPQVGSVGYEPGDAFLLCTDGVVDGLYDQRLSEFLCAPEADAPRVVAAAVENSGRDNTTAIVIRVQ